MLKASFNNFQAVIKKISKCKKIREKFKRCDSDSRNSNENFEFLSSKTNVKLLI